MLRVFSGALLALTLVVTSAAGATAGTFSEGVTFNNPVGTRTQKYAIRDRVAQAIDETPTGATIRIATWEYDDQAITQKLLLAHDRGVTVQVIVDSHIHPNDQFDLLKSELATDATPGNNNATDNSFAMTCKRGCRSTAPAAMHAKYFTFTQTGESKNVVMVSSTNLTTYGAIKGFNDMYTLVGRPAMFEAFADAFDEMALDQADPDSFSTASSGRFTAYFYPRIGTTRSTDDTYQALQQVRCSGALGGAGEHGHTAIRVSMWHWGSVRGEYLAKKLHALDNAGCAVHVTYGAPSDPVVRILRAPTRYGGIDLHDSRVDLDHDGRMDHYVHTKYMAISGVFAGDRSSWVVYTGSQNWMGVALRLSDEIMLRITGPAAYHAYRMHFAKVRGLIGHPVRILRRR